MHSEIALHLVGGFLGSGKTTAIVQASRRLMALGKRVAVVTNDQGKYLVDTEFVRQANLPTVEVTGGCFCCHYDDLAARLEQLAEQARPDVIFAESVGSCADLIATVIKPLQQLSNTIPPTSFSVFADSRMLRARLLDLSLPFSDEVLYIFDQQIEEAGLLVMNKTDLMNTKTLQETLKLVQARFPGKPLEMISALADLDITRWLDRLQDHRVPLPQLSLSLDYDRYTTGETRLAWLDAEYSLEPSLGQGREVLVFLLEKIVGGLRGENTPIGHVKFLIRWDGGEEKVSFTTQEVSGWESQIPDIDQGPVNVLINARSETSPEHLQEIVEQAVQSTVETYASPCKMIFSEAFRPGKPQPTYHFP
jgi:G3E family GTPase